MLTSVLLGVTAQGRPGSMASSASDPGMGTMPLGSFVFGVAALLVVCGCLLVALKLCSAMRGGKLGRGWTWIASGFGVFGVAQLLLFVGEIGVIPLWLVWVDALRVISLVLLFVGVSHIRKLLA